MLQNQQHRFFNVPKFKIGDIVVIRTDDSESKLSKLNQGIITMAWVEEDDEGMNSYLMGRWQYVIDLKNTVTIKSEEKIIFKLYK